MLPGLLWHQLGAVALKSYILLVGGVQHALPSRFLVGRGHQIRPAQELILALGATGHARLYCPLLCPPVASAT